MNDELIDEILNMYKTGKPLKIEMPCPSSRKRIPDDRASVHVDSQCINKDTSETDYVKIYKEQDDQEYLKVI